MEPDTYEEFSPKRDFFAITLAGVERKATNQREIGAGVMLDKGHFSLNTIAVYSDLVEERFSTLSPGKESTLYSTLSDFQTLFTRPKVGCS